LPVRPCKVRRRTHRRKVSPPLAAFNRCANELPVRQVDAVSLDRRFHLPEIVGGYLVASALRAPFLSALAFIVVLGGLVDFLLGDEALRRWLFPLAYLGFAVPLPFIDAVVIQMQSLTAQAATALVRAMGVPAVSEGGRITLTSCSLVVGAPCSGMRSLVALLAVAAVLAYLLRGSWLRRGALFVLAAPLAVAANVIRVISLLLVANGWGEEAALRYWHTFASPLFFLAALGLLIAASWGLGCREIRADI